MLTIPRSMFRSLRLLRRKCVVGRPRGPAPPLHFHCQPKGCVMAIHFEEVILTTHISGSSPNFDSFQLPGDILDTIDGPGDEAVTLALSKNRIEIQWNDRGVPQVIVVDGQLIEDALPNEPKTMSSMPIELVSALHEASRTTSRDSSRFALHRVQIQGNSGDVIASDAITLYWHKGFTFPFSETILVPAIPLFGVPVWSKLQGLSCGKTERYFVVRSGPWTAYLLIDKAGRFPDVKSVVPKTASATTFEIDRDDALRLRECLPKLPGHRDDKQPVTLDLVPGQPAVARGRDEASGAVSEIVLSRSQVRNGPSKVSIDRAFLLRAMQLNCITIRVASSDKPIVACSDRITWLAASLHPSSIVPPTTAAKSLVTSPIPVQAKGPPMKLPEPNGQPHDRNDSIELNDPLAEAEQLRAFLTEATQAAGRLVAMLKAKKKEQKALATVYSSLKSLNLGP